MKIAIYSNELNKLRIQTEIASLYRLGVPNIDLKFVDRDKCTDADIVVIDFDYINEFCNEYSVLNEKKILLFLDGFIFDPFDMDSNKRIEHELIAKKHWRLLRRINDAKIFLSYMKKDIVLNTMPNYLQLEMTSFCNARCIMCPHIYQGNKHAEHLPMKNFGKIKEILPYIEVAVLHGNGEPFMNPYIEDYLNIYKSYDIQVSACTNLSIFNDRLACLVNESFSDLRISCDACERETYESIRKGLSFDQLIKKLKILKKYCHKVHKVFTFVIMRQNISQISGMVEFAHNFGINEIIYSNMIPSIALENENDSPIYYEEFVNRELHKADVLAKRYGVKIIYPRNYNKNNSDLVIVNPIREDFKSQEMLEQQIQKIEEITNNEKTKIEKFVSNYVGYKKILGSGICDWLIEKIYIDVEGNACICCINSTKSLGNIYQEQFQNIWNGSVIQDIRKHCYENYLPTFCQNCQFVLNNSLKYLKLKGES